MEAILALALALLFGSSPTQNQVNLDNPLKKKKYITPQQHVLVMYSHQFGRKV